MSLQSLLPDIPQTLVHVFSSAGPDPSFSVGSLSSSSPELPSKSPVLWMCLSRMLPEIPTPRGRFSVHYWSTLVNITKQLMSTMPGLSSIHELIWPLLKPLQTRHFPLHIVDKTPKSHWRYYLRSQSWQVEKNRKQTSLPSSVLWTLITRGWKDSVNRSFWISILNPISMDTTLLLWLAPEFLALIPHFTCGVSHVLDRRTVAVQSPGPAGWWVSDRPRWGWTARKQILW